MARLCSKLCDDDERQRQGRQRRPEGASSHVWSLVLCAGLKDYKFEVRGYALDNRVSKVYALFAERY